MKKKLCLYTLIIIFLSLSVLYQIYSQNRELFHIHNIPKGSLSYQRQSLNLNLSLINGKSGFQVVLQLDQANGKILKFNVDCQSNKNRRIFNDDSVNFITIFQSKGDIKSHGDSFYHVKDFHSKYCIDQIISSIYLKDEQLFIQGRFSDCSQSNYLIKLSKRQRKQINIVTKVLNSNYNRIIIYFYHKNSKNYFGLGEQFSYLNLGHNRPYSLFVREKGVGRTDQPETFMINYLYGAGGSYYGSYSPTPIWLSVEVDTTNKSVSTGYIANSWAYLIWMNNQILVWDNQVQVRLLLGDTTKQIVKMIAQFNGYTPPVPDWVNQGAIVGLQGGTQAVMKKYQILKKSQAKITGLWLQDWVNKRKSLGFSRLWWNWQLDKVHYNGWDQMKSQLKKQRVNLLIYINPMLSNVQGKKQNYTSNFFKEAKQKQYFIKNKMGIDFQTSAFADWTASLIDFKNKEAKIFYQDILRNALKQTDSEGLMIDFGQAYPVQRMNETLENVIKQHNLYPTIYHEAAREVLDQFKDRQLYTFSRAGYLFAPKYTLSIWAGDQSMNFKRHSGLPSCLIAMLSSSLVGYSNNHCDIGGYSSYKLPFYDTSVRSPLLMTRWMQLASFSPVFRTHEGNLPQQSLQVYSNPQIADQFSFYSYIFSTLSQYRKKQALISQEQKIPLVRPMFLQNQNDLQVLSIYDQYYLGKDILVSPIITNKNKRRVYIPKGEWINIWSNKQVKGCDCYYESEQYEILPPVLIRQTSQFKDKIIGQIRNLIQKYESKIPYLRKKSLSKREEM